jgi:hypothetical protein
MTLDYKIKFNSLFFYFLIFFLLFQNFSYSEWITKKSDTSKELLKVDDMYSKGYLTKNECTQMKAKLLKVSDATGMCDNVILVIQNTENINMSFDWMAEVKHPKSNKIFKATRLSTKEKAINLAIKKCYAYVSSSLNKKGYNDCYVSKAINVKDSNSTETYKKEKKSTYITKKDKKKEKDLSKKLITKKEKSKNHYQKIKDLPRGQFYFVAFGLDNLKIIGYVNTDPDSKTINLGDQRLPKTSIGNAYVNDKKTSCDVISEVDGMIGDGIYRGSAILDCKNKGKFFGNWVQRDNRGEGIGINNDGNQLQFYFVSNKIDAYNIKSPYIDFAKKEPSVIEEVYTPKEGVVNKEPIIELDLEKKIKPGSYKVAGKVTDNEQKDPPYLFIDDEKVNVNKDGSFEFPMFTLNDTEITILAVDKRGIQKEVVVKIFVEKEIQTVEKLQKLNPQKIKTKKSKDRLAVIIGVEKYKTIQKAAYAKSDAEYFTEYAKRAFGIESKNIKTLTDEQADYISSKKALFKWLKQKINPNQTEVLVFYSGHGLATPNGKEFFLLTSDSDGDFIEDTALSRKIIIERIASFNPKSVTMFIDACYSGETRDSNDDELLIASAKPLMKLEDDSKLPDNFNMFSASQMSQASSSTKKETGVQNGIFSYYLMMGLEGNADLDNDGKITNGELYKYLIQKVPRVARSLHNREQEPFFKGNSNSVLVKLN